MKGAVRVLVYHDTTDEAAIRAAYREASGTLAGVPGLLGNELLRGTHHPEKFVVASYWSSVAAFQRWETGVDHKDSTAPLRPFRDTSLALPFGIYQVDDSY
ncbi:MAG TPA: antibiotic biosynthesis monooxygenase [Pseudonocardiaceae bacterium]|nr:antibiotic biosynthesis monooxygenase [Pseudonocardiaceae bacterium]